MVKISKEQGEFFKIKNCSYNGKVGTVLFGDNYIKDLLYDGEYDDEIDKNKKNVIIRLNK
jgi:hypothetical protein